MILNWRITARGDDPCRDYITYAPALRAEGPRQNIHIDLHRCNNHD